ncbi:hypothetical protein C1C98_31370 [Pseudomonas ogarae]|uniref:Uncharacterized protein n=1 Tax=Pseudomonas ogarae (strain DSM 112162 / CECT 30235 / F113) TaxID=1114970 RepID=A0ABM6R964_PSEO1|nr:hypothetical protein C1C98_31370 [Pseudomonas ogarae]
MEPHHPSKPGRLPPLGSKRKWCRVDLILLWEQSLLAKQAPRFLGDRVAFIAGKPCSHRGHHSGLRAIIT